MTHKDDEHITAWVTKYALTIGIMKREGHVCHSVSSEMFSWRSPGDSYDSQAHGRDWHRTEDAAKARAEVMRRAKIASLLKAVAKLEAMTF